MYSIFYKIWASFTPNFGGIPFQSNTDHIASYKTLVLVFMMDGLVLWTTYQSEMYADLSKPLIKEPFNDLDSLVKSDYMWASLQKYLRNALKFERHSLKLICFKRAFQ